MFRISFVILLIALMPMVANAQCVSAPAAAPAVSDCGEHVMPCACFAWVPYCGCEMVNELCISMEADCCDPTEGPLYLQIRNADYKTVAMIELPGPIDGYYTATYTFDEPVPADSLVEATIINETDDAVTLTWFQVVGVMECSLYTYFDYTCAGVVIGPEGCPRMVLF